MHGAIFDAMKYHLNEHLNGRWTTISTSVRMVLGKPSSWRLAAVRPTNPRRGGDWHAD